MKHIILCLKLHATSFVSAHISNTKKNPSIQIEYLEELVNKSIRKLKEEIRKSKENRLNLGKELFLHTNKKTLTNKKVKRYFEESQSPNQDPSPWSCKSQIILKEEIPQSKGMKEEEGKEVEWQDIL